jgi:hypothetical protein
MVVYFQLIFVPYKMIDTLDRKNIQLAGSYFLISTIITGGFIAVAPLYDNLGQQLLSSAIAGAKWMIQLVFAIIFLQGKRWNFMKNIGFTCLLGSLILLPYTISSLLGQYNDIEFFLGSLIISVGVMIFSYYRSVKKSGVPNLWWAAWMLCLIIAIIAQLKVVFNLWVF